MYQKIRVFIEHKLFNRFIILLIILNGITLGLETSKDVMSNIGDALITINTIILAIFVVEIVLRIFVYRLSFFKDPWSLFDFFVVTVSLVPARDGFEALRVLRVLRLFRLVTVIPQMRKVVAALVAVIPG
ncbi:MAG TPA: ion transporter, partial [Epsilonproteobacteria bacterium]|nr:ion transporter [Campylobacterota bacterium]